MCIMLGYGYNTVGVKLLSMCDGGVSVSTGERFIPRAVYCGS
jgi:hypothetical protein